MMTLDLMKPPVQDRSRRTLEALAAATERLLEARPFAAISIQEIAAEAGCTTGSFYRRFAAKDDILPYLFERYDEAHAVRLAGLLASEAWEALSLAGLVDRFIAETVAAYAGRPNLMRELMFFTRRAAVPEAARARRDGLQGKALDLFQAAAVREGSPISRQAAAFAMTVVGNSVREMVLFGDAALARSTRLEHAPLRGELASMIMAYLTSPSARG